jgi:hypothetical protein
VGTETGTSADLQPGFGYELEHALADSSLTEFAPEEERDDLPLPSRDDRLLVSRDDRLLTSYGHTLGGPLPVDAGQRLPGRRWGVVLPLSAAAIAVLAVVGALALRDRGLAPLPHRPAPWPRAAALTSIRAPELPQDAATDAAPAVPPPRPAPGTAFAPREPVRPEQRVSTPAAAAIDEVLASVRQSYRALDAASLTSVWPRADIEALSQRFSALKYQSLSFDRCDLRPLAGGQVVASCAVSIAAASERGDPTLLRRHESWSIVFYRSGDRYVIGSVAVR